ncbi:MAG: hypothetical protein ABEJ22_04755 [Haloferacaceae archaeon]
MPSRRRVLGAVATLAASSGCVFDRNLGSGSSKSLHFESVPESELGAAYVADESEWTPVQRSLVGDGVPGEADAYGVRPFEADEFVLADGIYYEVSVTEDGTETVERPVLSAEAVDEADGEVGDFGNLSPTDLQAVKCAVASTDDDSPDPCVIHAGEASAFWPDPDFEYVRVSDDLFRLHAEEQSVSLTRYRYEFERVADSHAAFLERYRDELVAVDFDAASLTDEQREMLRTAASEGVYEESPPYSDGYSDLLDRLDEAATRRKSYVRFDGGYYLAWTLVVAAD